MRLFFRNSFVPLLLIVLCPPTVLVVWTINSSLGGSILAFWNQVIQDGFFSLLYQIWRPVFFGTVMAWKIIVIFMAVQLILMRVVPGKRANGPMTSKGHVPVYKDNGMACFILTMGLFYLGAYPFGWFSPTIVYDNFAGILGALNFFSLLFCLFLYVKGRLAPSTPDHGTSGNFIFDYYWGTELYPRILGWDVKQFTNCRFGMMSWPVIILSFAAKQAQLFGLSSSMVVSVAIMMIYIAKFFWWEVGYLRSTDIMVDRAGFYICWGCLVWVPAIYTLPVMYLVNHPIHLSVFVATMILLLGVIAVMSNYFADAQRQKVRALNGQCKVWGKEPKLIRAQYVNEQGQTRDSLLLASGWWGISRHFHYVLEIALAFFWTLPALFDNFMPWFYVIYLTILLVHRAYRDEERCLKKYGHYWQLYCGMVPNKILPTHLFSRSRKHAYE